MQKKPINPIFIRLQKIYHKKLFLRNIANPTPPRNRIASVNLDLGILLFDKATLSSSGCSIFFSIVSEFLTKFAFVWTSEINAITETHIIIVIASKINILPLILPLILHPSTHHM
jgi:hypothetical protein